MTLLEIKNLKTYYLTPQGSVKAVDGVTLKLDKGTTLGLAGESGCGKTTIGLSIMRILPYPGKILEGQVLLNGVNILNLNKKELLKMRWKRISMVFQGAMASLNPLFKVGYQVIEPILLHEDVTKVEASKRAQNLFSLVGLDESRLNNYPWELSGGMRQRAMIAMALACNPDMLIADEPTTALDVIVSAQVMELITDLKEKLDLSMLLITHDISVIAQTCEELAIMYAGKIVEHSDTPTIFESPIHPYTNALMSAFPNIKGKKERLSAITGSPPDLIDPPPGCRFHPRCPDAQDICKREEPEFLKIGKDHFVACHLSNEILAKR